MGRRGTRFVLWIAQDLHICDLELTCLLKPQATEEQPIDPAEKATLRTQLVPAMVALSSQSKLLRSQIADTVGLVAAVDFPNSWPNLLSVRDSMPA